MGASHGIMSDQAVSGPIYNPIANRNYLETIPAELRDAMFGGMPWMSLAALAKTSRFLRQRVGDFKERKSALLRRREEEILREWEQDTHLPRAIVQAGAEPTQGTAISPIDDVVPGSVRADIVLRQRKSRSLPCYNCLENLDIDKFLPISEAKVPKIRLRRRCIDCRLRTRIFDDAWDHEHGFYIVDTHIGLYHWHGLCLQCDEPRLFIKPYTKYRYTERDLKQSTVPWASLCLDCQLSDWVSLKQFRSKGWPMDMTEAKWIKLEENYFEKLHDLYEASKSEHLKSLLN